MKVQLEGLVLAVKTDGSPNYNFVSIIQETGGKTVPKCDVVYPKEAELPPVGSNVSIPVWVKSSIDEYRGKQYPRLSFFFNLPKTPAGAAA